MALDPRVGHLVRRETNSPPPPSSLPHPGREGPPEQRGPLADAVRRTLHPAVSHPQFRQRLHPPEANDPQDFPPLSGVGQRRRGAPGQREPLSPRPSAGETPGCLSRAHVQTQPRLPPPPHSPLPVPPSPTLPALPPGASLTLPQAWGGERGPEEGVSGTSVLFCSISGILAWTVPTGEMTPAPGPGSRLPKVHAAEDGAGARVSPGPARPGRGRTPGQVQGGRP